MYRAKRLLSRVPVLACLILAAIGSSDVKSQTPVAATVFEGARQITGDGSTPIENSAFTVENGRINSPASAGAANCKPRPGSATRRSQRQNGDAGDRRCARAHGISQRPDLRDGKRHPREPHRYARSLRLLRRGAILETGTARSDLAYELRADPPRGVLFRTAGRGFGMPGAGPGGPMRDFADELTSEAEASMDVQELAAKKADMIKIWVDDRNRTVEKLKPNLYRAIIDEAHKHDIRVLAHVLELADVKYLLRAGIDGFAHMVRDEDVDDELLGLLKARLTSLPAYASGRAVLGL